MEIYDKTCYEKKCEKIEFLFKKKALDVWKYPVVSWKRILMSFSQKNVVTVNPRYIYKDLQKQNASTLKLRKNTFLCENATCKMLVKLSLG